jgi:NAD(P)-dependent dehydrogenase (short-subunit alcohol dehydrogenase family)
MIRVVCRRGGLQWRMKQAKTSKWTVEDIPRQDGKLAIVTGATGGIGFDAALVLAGAGAEVVLIGRSDEKGRDALARIKARLPSARVSFENVDLASLGAVADFAGRFAAAHPTLDLLINNAGVMAYPTRRVSPDGFELQLAINYLSHFALTARLLPTLRRGTPRRVVNISSIAHREGRIDFEDLQGEEKYVPWKAYRQSKLAMLMFALELQRRSDEGGWGLMSVAAHPGIARTDIMANGPGWGKSGLTKLLMPLAYVFTQSSAAGAWPTLLAATSPEVKPGGYYGPDGFQEMKGSPTVAKIAAQALDVVAAKKLWEVSEQLTGVRFTDWANHP